MKMNAIMVVADYAVIVPHVENEQAVFPKAAFPSRTHTQSMNS